MGKHVLMAERLRRASTNHETRVQSPVGASLALTHISLDSIELWCVSPKSGQDIACLHHIK